MQGIMVLHARKGRSKLGDHERRRQSRGGERTLVVSPDNSPYLWSPSEGIRSLIHRLIDPDGSAGAL